MEVLKGAGLWEAVQPKLVYGTSISMAKQFAASGSANAAFTAYSLVLHEKGTVLKIDSPPLQANRAGDGNCRGFRPLRRGETIPVVSAGR